jgi:protein-tyrosine phosphatase
VLPGVDDGPAATEDAVAMARQAAADDIAVICATPHIRHDHDVRIEQLATRVADLADAVSAAGIPVTITTGGEVAEPLLGGLDDDELRALSLGGGGRWILVEPRPGPLGDELHHAVATLQRRGFGALIAHPERHAGPDLADRLHDLIEAGALVQFTSALLAAGPAAATMRDLAARGLVHVLGSDAHSARAGRPVKLSDGLAVLAGIELLRDHIDWIARDGPAAILRGDRLVAPYAASGRS